MGGRTVPARHSARFRFLGAVRARQEFLALLVVVALLGTTGVANFLWTAGLPSTTNDSRMSPQEDPFPVFPAVTNLHVLPVPSTTNESTRLTLVSLQGLVNRNRAELYLDFENETGNTSSMLTFLTQRYGVTYDVVSLAWVYRVYLPLRSGIVVYDPARLESVNVATMLSSIRDAVLAGPDTATFLSHAYGLPVVFDYASSDWAALDAIGAYDRALREIYPRCDRDLLAILQPDQLLLRDYLIASRTFVFYDDQGILASPAALASTQRVLAATPRGIPILGWIRTPTVTEENAFVQLASKYGKVVLGTQAVPNLSVLGAYGRNERHTQNGDPGPALRLENKTYAVVGISDGDNLDFAAHRERDLWDEPERGTFPIAWSLSPLLADLAPPYLDYYYGSASKNDRFVAGPSGAGYLYPDYLGPGDLEPYLQFTHRHLDAADMDVVWLLNAFPASEIPYAPATLSAYVDALQPRGLVLDYDDQPRTQDLWMQGGAKFAAPVVRSTHLWTTLGNFLGKVGAATAAWDSGPHFLWLTVYPFRFDLHGAKTMVDELSRRMGNSLVLVTPEQFFALMDQDFAVRARAQLASMQADPIASALFAPALQAAQGRLDATLDPATPSGPAYRGYLVSRDLRAVAFEEGLLVVGLVVVAVAVLAATAARGPPLSRNRVVTEARSLVVLTASFALFMLSVRTALAANFWSYQWLVVGVLLAGLGRPLRRYLERVYPRGSPPATAFLDLVFVGLALGTNVAFGLAAIGTVAVVDGIVGRERVRPGVLLLSMGFGTAAGFLLGIDLPSFGVLAVGLVLPLFIQPATAAVEEPRGAKGVQIRGFILALPLVALAVASNYSLGLRFGLAGPDLSMLAAVLLAFGPLAGLLVLRRWRGVRPRIVQTVAFGLAAVLAAAVAFVTGTVATVLLSLVTVAALALAAERTVRLFVLRGGSLSAVAASAVSWIPLYVLVFRMPPIVYSLTLVHLPEAIEYAMYAPELLFAAGVSLLAFAALSRHLRGSAVGKGYPAETPLGGRGLR